MRKFRGKAILLVAIFVISLILPNFYVNVFASDNMLLINDLDMEGDTNKFTFHGEGWRSGSTGDSITGDEHFNVVNREDTNAETKYYTIDFIGNKIEVYGHKSWNHGIMSYSIDGGEPVEVSSYSSSRKGNQLLFTAEGLDEGAHKLTVVATGKTDAAGGQAVIQVDYAKVYHEKYQVDDIILENSEIELMEGSTRGINYQVVPSYATVEDITFTSNNPEIAIVNGEGTIEAIAEGSTTIVIESQEFSIRKEISVVVRPSVKGIHGTIVDTNTHYTQDKYNDILNMGLMSKELFAWKADKALSEIAIVAKDSALKNVTVTSSDFVSGENVLSSENIKTTFIKETLAYTGHGGYHDGNITIPEGNREEAPEILYTSEPVDIGFNKVQPVWVEFNIPENTPAGMYTGTITVTTDDIDTALVFTYNVEVLDIVMPDSMEYDFDFEAWQYPYSSAEYYNVEPFSEEHFNILRPQMLKYKELGGHAITASIVEEAWGGQTYSANEIRYPSMVKWTKNTFGQYQFDFTDFDKWVQFNKDLGIGDKIVCYSMIPWGNKVTYYDEATSSNLSVALTPGTAAYEEVWLQFLNAMVPHLDQKGWFDDVYIGIDERGAMDKAFDVVDKVKNKDGKTLKKAGAMDHFGESYFNTTSRMDDLSVGSISAKGDLDLYKKFVENRNNSDKEYRTTIYTCTGHFPNSFSLSMPGESYWTMMFTAAQGATGYMRWAFDAWVEDPLRDITHWAFESGDTALIYPDEKDVENPMPKSSVRLEKMAEGIRDVNKLYLMEKKMPELSEDIDALFASVKLNYTANKNGIGSFGGAQYATDETRAALPKDMENLRLGIKAITEKYIELRKNRVEDVTGIEVNKEQVELTLGASETLDARVLPTNTLNFGVQWSSSDADIVKVNKVGKIEAVSLGEATITVKSTYNPEVIKEITVTVKEADLSSNAIAYYDFEDITSNVVEDKWNNYNGVLEGAEVIEGPVGDALQFNNGSDNVTIESPATLDKSWTLAMWVKKGDIQNRPASIMWDGKNFTSGSNGTESIDIEKDTAGNLGVHVNSGFLTIKRVLPKEQWTHLAWVNDKTKGLTLYIDGEATGTNAWTVNNTFKAPLKVIGGRNYIGAIDEVKVYDTPLSKAEVDQLRKLPGLNVSPEYVEVMINESAQINAELIGDFEDKTITFESRNPDVASVNQNGLITGVRYGDTEIVVTNKATGFTKIVGVRVNKDLNIGYTIPEYDYPVDKQIVIDREPGQYLGHPDMIALDDNNLLTVYPKGHGIGPIIMKKSTDGGITWSDRLPTNPTWETSKECPTIYKLDMVDGTTKLIEISGAPGRGGVTGWDTSISDDNGETWSDFKNWHSGQGTIVAMASLTQLKDENGNFIDKWMGVYHNGSYVNYKSYLTFDENGNEQWSTPEAYLSQYRDIESQYQICEVGMFRSPDGNRIVALGRSQSHMNLSTMFYSDDEGKTWSKPRPMQGALLGERHKATYDPISGRILVTFREIILDYNNNGAIESGDWMAGDWIAWVGTYEDLMNGEEGDYRIRLAKDYTPSAKSGDTGYAGNVALSDGTFVLNSYGCFDENDPVNNPNGSAYKPYIVGMRFKLGEIDNALGLVDKTKLEYKIAEVDGLNENDYTAESWSKLVEVLNKAKVDVVRNDIQQIEVDEVLAKLTEAITNLEEGLNESGDVNNDGVVNIMDLALVSKYYGKNATDNADVWNEIKIYDINKDGIINDYETNYIMDKIIGR